MSHPSLGLPPTDLTAGMPEAAERMRAAKERLAGRALEVALAETPGMRERYDEAGLRQRLRDAELMIERVALAVASGDTTFTRTYADMVVAALSAPVRPARRPDRALQRDPRRPAGRADARGAARSPATALDAAIEVYRWHRRLAGDARKKNPILQFLYKGG